MNFINCLQTKVCIYQSINCIPNVLSHQHVHGENVHDVLNVWLFFKLSIAVYVPLCHNHRLVIMNGTSLCIHDFVDAFAILPASQKYDPGNNKIKYTLFIQEFTLRFKSHYKKNPNPTE